MRTCPCHGAIRRQSANCANPRAGIRPARGYARNGLVPGLNGELETMNSGQFQTPGRDQGQCEFVDSPTAMTSGNPVADRPTGRLRYKTSGQRRQTRRRWYRTKCGHDSASACGQAAPSRVPDVCSGPEGGRMAYFRAWDQGPFPALGRHAHLCGEVNALRVRWRARGVFGAR